MLNIRGPVKRYKYLHKKNGGSNRSLDIVKSLNIYENEFALTVKLKYKSLK